LNQYPHDGKVFIDCGEGEVKIETEVTGKIIDCLQEAQ
jgi:hypothetical protein